VKENKLATEKFIKKSEKAEIFEIMGAKKSLKKLPFLFLLTKTTKH
jgi:hypothetical protein